MEISETSLSRWPTSVWLSRRGPFRSPPKAHVEAMVRRALLAVLAGPAGTRCSPLSTWPGAFGPEWLSRERIGQLGHLGDRVALLVLYYGHKRRTASAS
jgi:hypothetical protein